MSFRLLLIIILVLVCPTKVYDVEVQAVKKHTVQPEVSRSQEIKREVFKITWYTIYDEGCDKITATGYRVKPGDKIVAVDPSVIPLGSTVVIQGEKYIALDVFGDNRGFCIDILVDPTLPEKDAKQEAFRNGVKYEEVIVRR